MQAVLAVGAAGGSAIISGTATVAFRNLWLGWDLKAAIDAPRFHNQLMPNVTNYESGFPDVVSNSLLCNHKVESSRRDFKQTHVKLHSLSHSTFGSNFT